MFERIKRGFEGASATEGDEEGFTLVELLIVVVILGILAAVTVFGLSGSTSKSNKAACNTDARSVEVAVEAYHSDNGAWPSIASGGVIDGTNLLGVGSSGPYLRTKPTNSHYAITLGANGVVLVNNIDYDAAINGTITGGNPCDAVT
jgi:prepilin-type N-terminal cleavage/methylation domain-containing protein